MCGFADVDSIPLSERKALAATLSLPVDYAHDVCEIRGVSCANGHVRSIASPKYADLASFQKHNIRVGAASTLKSTQFFCSLLVYHFSSLQKPLPLLQASQWHTHAVCPFVNSRRACASRENVRRYELFEITSAFWFLVWLMIFLFFWWPLLTLQRIEGGKSSRDRRHDSRRNNKALCTYNHVRLANANAKYNSTSHLVTITPS